MYILAKLTLTIRITEVFSLKQKRSIVKRIKNQFYNANKICIAETHQQDSLRFIGITIGILSNKKSGLQTYIEKLNEEVEIISEGFIEEKKVEII